ncbi:LOW QUALITY PROTEIN: hypothetical protein QYF61_001304 [Mycteria americana]|uniref:Uncharacterized protein n=1 Tax=Mycteria americana TaxID=33587 RepID=A0AAN7NJP0_MYCAM|nr:LOW QUALITY PROTEIN: hypothetical protein QYF61_001304 [Mycteria americana]
MLDNPFSEEIFPNIQSKPPLVQLQAILSYSIAFSLGEETDTHLATPSFQVAVESEKVSPQPPFLQAKQPQFPQLLLIGLTLHQLRCPSLDTLRHLNVCLVVRGPKLNTVFKVWPHQCQVEGDKHFPSPAGHSWKRPLRSSSPTVNLALPSPYTMSLSTTSTCLLNTSRDGDSTTSLGSLFQCLTTLLSKPPLVQLEAISSYPMACSLGDETDPHLATTSFQAVVESEKVSPQPLLLQAQQPHFPQLLLIRLLLQTQRKPDGLAKPCGCFTGGPGAGFPFSFSSTLETGRKENMQQCCETERSPVAKAKLERPVPMLDNSFSENFFPNTQSKPPLAQLEAISSHPMACSLGEETDPHLATTSFQVVVESDKVSPQPPFLQAQQPQFPQLLLIRLVLQTLHQLRCPSLDTLQHLNVSLVVRGPKLNTGFEVRPHQCQVEGDKHFPSPAGHTISDTSQDAIGLLGHLGTLLAHIQLAVNQHLQVLLRWGAFQPLFPKPVALPGVVVTQVQDLALSLAESHTTCLGPSIQTVQVPLQSLPPLKQINTPTQLGVVCKLTEGALDPFVQIIDKDIKQNQPQY